MIKNLSVGSLPITPALDPVTGEVYVPNYTDHNLSLISSSSDSVVGSVQVGVNPETPTYDAANGFLYVANHQSSNVSVISTPSNVVLESIPVGGEPQQPTLDPATGALYVVNLQTSNVTVINGSTNSVQVAGIAVGDSPYPATYDPLNGDIYVSNSGSNSVDVISGQSNTVKADIGVGTEPVTSTFDPLSGDMYVSNWGSGDISLISSSTNRVVGSVNTGGFSQPQTPVFDAANGELYIPLESRPGEVAIVNGTTNALITIVSTGVNGAYPAVLDPISNVLYVSNAPSQVVSLIDCDDNALLANIVVENFVNASDFGPDTPLVDTVNGLIYVPIMDTASITVLSTLNVSGLVSPMAGDAPLRVTFTGVPRGGTGHYPSWNWSFGDGNFSNAQNTTHTYTTAGTFAVNLTMIDSSGMEVRVPVTVISTLPQLLLNGTLTPSVIDLGMNTSMSLSYSGGAPPYTFAFGGAPPGCANLSLSNRRCTPAAAGSYDILVGMVDTTGRLVEVNLSLVVNLLPVITAFSATPAVIWEGNQTNFSATVRGGTLPITLTYLGVPDGCSPPSSATWSCTPDSTGNFSVRLYVNDSFGASATQTTLLTVTRSPLRVLSFSATPEELQVGNWTNLTVQPAGGVAPLSFDYVGLPDGCASSSQPLLACRPQAVGNFDVRVYVNDSLASSATASLEIGVEPAPVTASLVSVSIMPGQMAISEGASGDFEVTSACSTACPNSVQFSWELNSTLATLNATTGTSVSVLAGDTPGALRLEVVASLNLQEVSANASVQVYATTNATNQSHTNTPSRGASNPYALSRTQEVVVGGLGLALLLGVVCVWMLRRDRKKNRLRDAETRTSPGTPESNPQAPKQT